MMLDRVPWWSGALLATACIVLLIGAPALTLVHHAGELPWQRVSGDPWLRRVLHFSLTQAALSTLLALLVGIPAATALHHERRFPGRHWLTTLFGICLVLPAIAAVFGLVTVWGGAGWMNHALDVLTMGLRGEHAAPRVPVLYGMNGILLAHVFFNAPLMTRVLLQALDGIPDHEWRLASQLGLPATTRFRRIELPRVLASLPGLLVLVFTLCFTSFAVVLALGGGPRATTLEVAIYQALRFDFDLPLAVALALVQLSICLALSVMGGLLGRGTDGSLGLAGDQASTAPWPAWHPHQQRSILHRCIDVALILAITLLVVPPLVALLVSGINSKIVEVLTDPTTLTAVWRSIVTALFAAAAAVTLALCLLSGSRHLLTRHNANNTGMALQLMGNAILVMPPVVLGTGLFLLVRSHADVFALALVLVIIVNALMGLPFALRLLAGPVLEGAAARDRLARSLGMPRIARWRYIDAPLLRRPLAQAAAVCATLAAGDLGAIALFGSERMLTLPLLLHTRLGSHRLDEAAVTAMLLISVCIALYAVIVRVVGGPRTAAS